ncbi:MAG: zinc dependent phospholipase C family protein [Clostridium sp.]|nr:zinc dependent phospholipase C family protein [Clostridium sp.]
MPAYSTHCIFAKEMMPFLRQTADFEIEEDAVLFGTQGPDIFFFHRVFPWMIGKPLRKIGSQLHRTKPSVILENMRMYCAHISQNKIIAKSYVYGFILHYVLDRRCHPYVYSAQYKMTDDNPFLNPHAAHNIVELSMDSYLLNKRFGVADPIVFDTACTISENEDIIAEIGKMYDYIIPRILGIHIPKMAAAAALRDMKTVQHATLDATGSKRMALGIVENIIAPFTRNYKFTAMMRPRDLEKAKKYGNIDNKLWKSPFDNSQHNESFEDLFEIAKAEAKQMITEYQAGCDTKEITKDLSFLTGVEVK